MFPNIDHKAVAALLHGQGCANSLKTLLENREIGSVSTEPLITTILDSFSLALSFIDSPNPPPPHQHHDSSSRYMAAPLVHRRSSKKKICGVKNMEHYRDDYPTPLLSDGFAWRKYGQKTIKTSPHQRSYYRCAYAKEKNCNATKRVQKIQDTPPVYRTTYVGNHMCDAPAFEDFSSNDDTHGCKMIRFEKCDHVISKPDTPQLASIDHHAITIENKATDDIMNQERDNNEFFVDDDEFWGYDFPTLSPGDLMFFDNITAFD